MAERTSSRYEGDTVCVGNCQHAEIPRVCTASAGSGATVQKQKCAAVCARRTLEAKSQRSSADCVVLIVDSSCFSTLLWDAVFTHPFYQLRGKDPLLPSSRSPTERFVEKTLFEGARKEPP